MGQNCKECFQLLLSTDLDNNNVNKTIELLKDFLNNSIAYTAEDMLYIMSIITHFDDLKISTKLLDLYMDEVKIHIRRILTEYLLNTMPCESSNDKMVAPLSVETKKIEEKACCNDIIDTDDNVYENFEGFIVKKKYTPGQELADSFKLPLEGQTANLKIKDELLNPDYIYFSEVEIDWQGNVLSYITAPKKISKNLEIQEVDFDEIYHELLNEVYEYKERPEV